MVSKIVANSAWTGARSFLSACSKPAIRWVTDRTGASDYGAFASSLLDDAGIRLKLDGPLREYGLEPDKETARKWSDGVSVSACHIHLEIERVSMIE